jgi:hypothetical protein
MQQLFMVFSLVKNRAAPLRPFESIEVIILVVHNKEPLELAISRGSFSTSYTKRKNSNSK